MGVGVQLKGLEKLLLACVLEVAPPQGACPILGNSKLSLNEEQLGLYQRKETAFWFLDGKGEKENDMKKEGAVLFCCY